MSELLDSSAVLTTLDAGHQSLPWTAPQTSGLFSAVDFQKILASEEPTEIIQSLPPQLLYLSLKRDGLLEHLDVLPHLSTDQVTRILDYDAWDQGHVVLAKAVEWLKPYGELGPEALATRFQELEEEYQLAMLDQKLLVFDEEEYEALSQAEQDLCIPMPGNKIFYVIQTQDEKEFEFIEQLIKSFFDSDKVDYAYMLLAHVGYQATHEAEETLRRFRLARLQEDGFVTEEESLELFQVAPMAGAWPAAATSDATELVSGKGLLYLDAVMQQAQEAGWDIDALYEVHQNLLYLANSLTVTARIECHDVKGLARLMEQGKALVSLGLEWMSAGNIAVAVTQLSQVGLKDLFKTGVSVVDGLRMAFADRCARHPVAGFSELPRLLRLRRFGAALWHIDTVMLPVIGQDYAEILKGLCNRFPMMVTAESMKAGALAIHFRPLSSLADLRRAWNLVNGLSGALSLQEKAGFAAGNALTETFATAALQVFLGHSFQARPITAEQRLKMTWTEAEWSAQAAGLFALLEQVLAKQQWDWLLVPEWGDASRAVSVALGMVGDTLLGMETGRSLGDGTLPYVTYQPAESNHD